jgi:DNA replication and repair protein RecF
MLIEEWGAPSGAGAAVFLRGWVGVTRLVLTDFRNYRAVRLQLGPSPVVVTGPNGAGKTNLLEAVSLLAPGRGLRRARLSEFDRRDAEGSSWAIFARMQTAWGELRIGTGREGGSQSTGSSAAAARERRLVRIDGEAARSQAALSERLSVTWLTPAMDRLFLEGPGERRRFLDRLVLALDPAHAARVAAYGEALRERSRLLREGPRDKAWLSAIEETMSREGVAVAAARREAVERLDRVCARAEGPFPQVRLRLAGEVEGWLAEMPALDTEEAFRAALYGSRWDDAETGGAAIGPHRSDLAVRHGEKGVAAELASTGEQKALLIAILLAHARLVTEIRGEAPLILLDEVAAHLDRDRRAALFAALLSLESQVWLSGTEEALFASLRGRAQFLGVCDGVLSAEPGRGFGPSPFAGTDS